MNIGLRLPIDAQETKKARKRAVFVGNQDDFS